MSEKSNAKDNLVSVVITDCLSYANKEAVRDAIYKSLELLGMDSEHMGLESWNPFSDFISPGMTVLIKPNFVMDVNHIIQNGTDCLFTQPEIIEVVIGLVCKALCGKGHIIVGDAPMQECDFENLKKISGIQEIIDRIASDERINIDLVDFRELSSVVRAGVHINKLSENTKGTIVNLAEHSQFFEDVRDWKKYRITNYDPDILPRHHNDCTNEYYISDFILQADVIINLPKPKTHRKAGVTLALKNLVGANARKEFLPHHTMGSVEEGGDEYKEKSLVYSLMNNALDTRNRLSAHNKFMGSWIFAVFSRMLYEILKRKKDCVFEGSWYGNDTISKTISDINVAVRYANKQGELEMKECRQVFTIGDMIIAGEKEGPVAPSPKICGIITAAFNSVCYDEVVSTVMGFDYTKIPTVVRARMTKEPFILVEPDTIPFMVSNDKRFHQKRIDEIRTCDTLRFTPSSGWKDHIELD